MVSGGTDNHLMLVDVTPLGLTGKVAEAALEEAGLTTNKNAIPFDPNPPAVASGIRLGTPAVTTRGMRESEMVKIGGWILQVLKDPDNKDLQQEIRSQVADLCQQFPLYADRLGKGLRAEVKV